MTIHRLSWTTLLGLVWALFGHAAQAAQVQVAVAANFSAPMRQIAAAFEKDSGHQVVLALGATGAFYAQIRNGAPFDVFLAADDTTPAKLEADGLGVKGSRFVYATGRLVLWSAQPGLVDDQGAVLQGQRIVKLAIADPRLAPYGLAAEQALTRLGLLEALRPRLVLGANIAQVHQFIASGNATAGFVALSQVYANGALTGGSGWVLPQQLHAPIRQEAQLLRRGADNAAAQALLVYLRGDTARRIMRASGYEF